VHRASNRVEREKRDRVVLGWSILISVLFHAAVFLLSGRVTVDARPGSTVFKDRVLGWRSGGAMEAVQVAAPSRIEVPPPPKPRIDPDTPILEVFEPVAAWPAVAEVVAPWPGSASGEASGAGVGLQDGESGVGRPVVTAPVPRSIVPQWDPPDEVRGMRVTVRVHVDAAGQPTGDVELLPPTPNRRFNRQLADKVRRMDYHPARRDGTPVAGWAEITFVF
jgi:TonB family protein